MKTHEMKLEIIRLILILEEEDILQNLYRFLKSSEETTKSKETFSKNEQFGKPMSKNEFLNWLKDCENSEMMTKQEFQKEFSEWRITMKERQ